VKEKIQASTVIYTGKDHRQSIETQIT